MNLVNVFPMWLQEEHETNGSTIYSVGSDAVYGVLSLNGNRVDYSLHMEEVHTNYRVFKNPKAAANFYLKAARVMKSCSRRGTVPTWNHLI